MYSKTSIVCTFEKFAAGIEMSCPYCSHGKINIAKGEELFYILGYRTYTRIKKELVPGQGFAVSMVPYVPWQAKRWAGQHTNPQTFTDPIMQHRMCQRCFAKLCYWMEANLSSTFNEKGVSSIVIKPFSMTNPCSLYNRTYRCRCCPKIIPGSTQYVRIGHYDTICASCAEILSGFIGTEFSS